MVLHPVLSISAVFAMLMPKCIADRTVWLPRVPLLLRGEIRDFSIDNRSLICLPVHYLLRCHLVGAVFEHKFVDAKLRSGEFA